MNRVAAGAAAALLAGAAAVSSGCATTAEKLAPVREAWSAGDLRGALSELDAVEPEVGDDWPLVALERSSVLQASGEFVPAADEAERAFVAMEENEAEDFGEWVESAFSDDTALAWEGDDHEKVLARAMASVDLLLAGQPDEARALALQVNRVQERLRAKPVLREGDGRGGRPGYRMFALGEYLQALVDENRGFFDEAAIGYRRAAEYGFAPAGGEVARVGRRRLVEGEGSGAVVVLLLAGEGPVREERVEPVTSAVFMVASSVLNARRGAGFPSQAPVVLPWPRARPSAIGALHLAAGGRGLGTTETILDVDEVAFRQAEDDLPRRVLRAVLRRAFKEASKNLVKDAVTDRRRPGWKGLLVDIGGYVWTGTERADTRCWSLLPKRFQVARVELPAGVARLELTPVAAGGGVVAPTVVVPVRVDPGRVAFVLAVAPNEGMAPWAYADGWSRP